MRSRLASAQSRYAKAVHMINDPELVRLYADIVRRLAHLRASIDLIPPATVRLTEQLAATAGRTQFDAALNDCVDDIGRRSFPESAAELLGVVNLSLRFAEFRLAGN